jgi:hypothetical protein
VWFDNIALPKDMNWCTELGTEVKSEALTEGNFKIMGFWEVMWHSLEARVAIITLNMEAAMLLNHQPTRRHIPKEVSNIRGEHHGLQGRRKTAVPPHNITTYAYS